jgi:hypothetical protein
MSDLQYLKEQLGVYPGQSLALRGALVEVEEGRRGGFEMKREGTATGLYEDRGDYEGVESG